MTDPIAAFKAAAEAAQTLIAPKVAEKERLLARVAAIDAEIAKYQAVIELGEEKPSAPPPRKRAARGKSRSNRKKDYQFTDAWPRIEDLLGKHPEGLRFTAILAELEGTGLVLTEDTLNDNLRAGKGKGKVITQGPKWYINPGNPALTRQLMQ
jgi:hypothetical protein